MALTEFGKAVRKARIDIGHTLLTMSNELGTTPAFLSGLETGSKKIPVKWVEKINVFFKEKGCQIDRLQDLADVSNEMVLIDSRLSQQQKMLVAGFAKSPFTSDQLAKFSALLTEVNGDKDQ
jgi:predicted transcriptional regulator